MLHNGADVRHLQAILGHADLATTARYTQVSIRDLQRVHARTHPSEMTVVRSRAP
jgi:integrase/recombinase XerD